MSEQEIATLRARFLQSYGSLDQHQLDPKCRAIAYIANLPNTPEGTLATSALNKLKNGDANGPTPAEWAALEYMIHLLRPSVFIHAGIPDDDTDPNFAGTFSEWTIFQHTLPPLSGSIGRISLVTPTGIQPQGTGFLIAPNLIMTNAHVLDVLSNGAYRLQRGQATIQFLAEDNDFSATPAVDITGVHVYQPNSLDACVLEIDDVIAGRLPLEFRTANPVADTQIAAVGFPYGDARDPLFTTALFGGIYGVKRAAAGFITSTQPGTDLLYHDCTTLGGSSGSPLLSLNGSQVLGLHIGGRFLWKNLAIPSTTLINWMDKQGVSHA
jgi:hypothetical protein